MTRRLSSAVLFAATVGCASCAGDALLGSGPAVDNAAIFDEVWQAFDLHYSYFGLKGVDWNASRALYRPAAIAAGDDHALAGVIGAMLRDLRDVHVVLTPDEGQSSLRYTANVAPLSTPFSPDRVAAEHVPDAVLTPGGYAWYGHLDAAIGYVGIESFRGRDWAGEIDDALNALDVGALVVDIRNNGGGDNGLAIEVAGRFTDQPRTYGYVRLRDGPAHDEFTDYIAERVRPVGRHFSGPVVVLTNRRTISAAEDFLLAMRAIPGVQVIGDTTAGASGGPIVRELPNGWTFQLSEWIAYDASRAPFEGIGLAPDIPVKASAQDGANDIVLDAARKLLLAELRSVPSARGGERR